MQASHRQANTKKQAPATEKSQESPGFESTSWLAPFCVENSRSPCAACVFSRYSSFVSHTKHIHVRLTGNSKLTVGVNISVNGCLCKCRSPGDLTRGKLTSHSDSTGGFSAYPHPHPCGFLHFLFICVLWWLHISLFFQCLKTDKNILYKVIDLKRTSHWDSGQGKLKTLWVYSHGLCDAKSLSSLPLSAQQRD